MKTRTEIITPEIAMEILEHHNPKNRNIAESTVQVYASDMKNNRWQLTHQGLAFYENGDLMDGQHRLWAVVFSGKSVEFQVTRGIPMTQRVNGVELNPMDAVDHNKVRGTGAQLNLSHGLKNGNNVAAACRGIIYMIYPSMGGKRISTATTLMILDTFKDNIDAVFGALPFDKYVAHLTSPLAFYHRMEPNRTLDFCQQFNTLENMTPPVRTLVKFLGSSASIKQDKKIRVVSSCIMAFHQKKESAARAYDTNAGMEFLVNQFPSIIRKLKEATKPIEGKIIRFKTAHA